MEMWTVVVEGLCYGFFNNRTAAIDWAKKEFPIAWAQGRAIEYEFCSV